MCVDLSLGFLFCSIDLYFCLTPVFLPEEFHGQRSLVGYSPWSCKESDMTEQLTF